MPSISINRFDYRFLVFGLLFLFHLLQIFIHVPSAAKSLQRCLRLQVTLVEVQVTRRLGREGQRRQLEYGGHKCDTWRESRKRFSGVYPNVVFRRARESRRDRNLLDAHPKALANLHACRARSAGRVSG